MSRARRRSHNEGTVFYREDRDRWVAQVSMPGGKRLSKTCRTKTEADHWRRTKLLEIRQGLEVDIARLSVEEYLLGWIDSRKSSLAPNTHAQYRGVVINHIIPIIGSVRLCDLTSRVVENLLRAKEREGNGARTVNLIRGVLHNAVEGAIRQGGLMTNPVKATNKRRYRAPEQQAWNDYQARQFLIAVRGHRFEALFHLALTTGLRQGELLGLKWQDLDWANRRISIRRQAQRVSGEGVHLRELKTRKSRRVIDLGDETIRSLRRHLDLQELQWEAAGSRWQDHDLIFPNTIGKPVDGSNLTKIFSALVASCGLPEIRFHDLRHTAGTLMLREGIHPKIVSERLGHASVQITLDIYAHALPSLQRDAAEALDELLSPIPVELPSRSSERDRHGELNQDEENGKIEDESGSLETQAGAEDG
jgi:integrase